MTPDARALRARTAAWAGFVAMALVSCRPGTIGPPPSPPFSSERPAELLPGDLDVAGRVDWRRLRDGVGPRLLEAIERRAGGDAAHDPPAELLVRDALQRASTLWFALRPGTSVDHSDVVVVMSGRFTDLDPRVYVGQSRWGPPVDLGAGWRRFERPRPALRSAPSVLYTRDVSLLVLASYAEIDAMRRRLEMGARDAHIEPPERGVAAVAARIRPLVRRIENRAPSLAAVLAGGRRLTLRVDLQADAVVVVLEIACDTEEDALRMKGAWSRLRDVLAHRFEAVRPVLESETSSVSATSFLLRWTLAPGDLATLAERVAAR